MTKEEKVERIAALSQHMAILSLERRHLVEEIESRAEKDARLEFFADMVHLYIALADADNRKLAWLLLSCPAYAEGTRPSMDIIAEAVHRLYPEYLDNDAITWQEYGWSTPEGQMRYV